VRRVEELERAVVTGQISAPLASPRATTATPANVTLRLRVRASTASDYRHCLLDRDTVEERVAELRTQKRDLVASIMGDTALLTKLTRSDLEALLDLGKSPG
jgi:hypothetical protein